MTALVVLLVHLVGVLLGVLLGTDLVDLIHTLGLGKSVDLRTDDASKKLLGESVANGLAWWISWRLAWLSDTGKGDVVRRETMHTLLALVVLEELHALEGSGTGQKLVGELGLVVLLAVVDLTVSLVGIVCKANVVSCVTNMSV